MGVCVALGGGTCVTGETVTAADGTHPTGMHSCISFDFTSKYLIPRFIYFHSATMGDMLTRILEHNLTGVAYAADVASLR